MTLKEFTNKNQEVTMILIGVFFLALFFLINNTILHMDITLFLIVTVGITFFICLCFVKICYDAITKPKPKHDAWDVIPCRECKLMLIDCKCHPIPCPFCEEVFGFLQDWNVHLLEFHKKDIEKAVNKE